MRNKKIKGLADLVIRRSDGTEIKRIHLPSISDRYVERVMMGMLMNMGEDFYIDDSEVDAARAKAGL